MKKVLLLIVIFITVFTLTGCKKEVEKTTVLMTVKNYGEITMELDPTYAKKTVENFLNLVELGFYNGLSFHRVIDGFMIQGGDPLRDGTGGSGNNIKGEFKNNGITNKLSHTRGVVSMARNPYNNDSASSQFFIVQEDSPHLDGDYAAFGKVTVGMEIVDEIAKNTKVEDDNGTVLRGNQPIIESIKIISATEE